MPHVSEGELAADKLTGRNIRHRVYMRSARAVEELVCHQLKRSRLARCGGVTSNVPQLCRCHISELHTDNSRPLSRELSSSFTHLMIQTKQELVLLFAAYRHDNCALA